MALGVETALRLFGGVILLFANGFFVTAEFAMTRVPQFDESAFRGSRGAELAWEMTDQLEIYLSGCQVGITVASVGLGVVAEPAVAAVVDAGLGAAGLAAASGEEHAAVSVLLALGLINILHVVIGEQAPTYLGVERSRSVATYVSRPLYYWAVLTAPVIRFADWVAKWLLGLFGVDITRSWNEAEEGEMSRNELRSEMGQILSRGRLPDERREEVLNALEIGDRPVREIVVPRDEMVTLSTAADVETNLETIRRNPQHVRFPLVDGDPERFVGVVYVPSVLTNVDRLRSGDRSFREVAVPPLTVDADAPIAAVIDVFQAENQELALVEERDGTSEASDRPADPDDPVADGVARVGDDPATGGALAGRGDVVGLVTASDAFEAITGDIEDPMDLGA